VSPYTSHVSSSIEREREREREKERARASSVERIQSSVSSVSPYTSNVSSAFLLAKSSEAKSSVAKSVSSVACHNSVRVHMRHMFPPPFCARIKNQKAHMCDISSSLENLFCVRIYGVRMFCVAQVLTPVSSVACYKSVSGVYECVCVRACSCVSFKCLCILRITCVCVCVCICMHIHGYN